MKSPQQSIDQERRAVAEDSNLLNQPDDPLQFQDLEDVTEFLLSLDPQRGVSLFHELNPQFNLQQILKAKPLEIFRLLVQMLKSDRWLSTIGD